MTRPEQFTRYSPIYSAFLKAEVPIIALSPEGKQPAFITARRSRLETPAQIEAALDWAGLNLGAVTHLSQFPSANPLGFCDLDIDGPSHGLDLSTFTVMVRRAGEPHRAHYWFRVPPGTPIRAYYQGTDYDLCTWNTVLPGSVHADGSVYELWTKVDGNWEPWDGEAFTLDMLPVIDPARFKPAKPANVQPFSPMGSLASTMGAEVGGMTIPEWVPMSGRPATLAKAAQRYARFYAHPSISGAHGHDALLVLVLNLRLRYKQDRDQTLALVRDHFNPRCVDKWGKPSPWADAEILHKWEQAGQRGAYPTLGVRDAKAKRKDASRRLQDELKAFLAAYTLPGGSVSPTDLRSGFVAQRGGEAVSATAFGIAMEKITGKRSSSPNGVRQYKGIRLTEAGLGLTNKGVGLPDAA